jgi:hypothetical protein
MSLSQVRNHRETYAIKLGSTQQNNNPTFFLGYKE